MSHPYRPTPRLQGRLVHVHDGIVRFLNCFEDIKDRRAPAPPEVGARARRLLQAAAVLLSRHRLAGEVRTLGDGPAPAAELFVRLLRAMVALRTLYDELEAQNLHGPMDRR